MRLERSAGRSGEKDIQCRCWSATLILLRRRIRKILDKSTDANQISKLLEKGFVIESTEGREKKDDVLVSVHDIIDRAIIYLITHYKMKDEVNADVIDNLDKVINILASHNLIKSTLRGTS